MADLQSAIDTLKADVANLQADLGEVNALVASLRDGLGTGGVDVSAAVAELEKIHESLAAIDTGLDAVTAHPTQLPTG